MSTKKVIKEISVKRLVPFACRILYVIPIDFLFPITQKLVDTTNNKKGTNMAKYEMQSSFLFMKTTQCYEQCNKKCEERTRFEV